MSLQALQKKPQRKPGNSANTLWGPIPTNDLQPPCSYVKSCCKEHQGWKGCHMHAARGPRRLSRSLSTSWAFGVKRPYICLSKCGFQALNFFGTKRFNALKRCLLLSNCGFQVLNLFWNEKVQCFKGRVSFAQQCGFQALNLFGTKRFNALKRCLFANWAQFVGNCFLIHVLHFCRS